MNNLPSWKDKVLFTPGPLTTSRTVKQAMLRDLGSRDAAFIEIVADIRRRLLALGGCAEGDYAAILVQGSGTFGIEAVLSSVIPERGRLLVLSNGAYGERMLKIAAVHDLPVEAIRAEDNTSPSADELQRRLETNPGITHVAVVHCETTTGLLNPVEEYGRVVRNAKRCYIVDAMSSFGAYPLDLPGNGIDYLISSANKCIEGVPGFSFVLARRASLAENRSPARTLSLDLRAQLEGLDADGQFRFTPPTHALLAFHQALLELEQEGGVAARAARYGRNHAACTAGMAELGFEAYLAPGDQGHIITSFRYPEHPRFDFRRFYEALSEKRFIIYPGKLSKENCFRIGHVGRIDVHDVHDLLAAVRQTLAEMGVETER